MSDHIRILYHREGRNRQLKCTNSDQETRKMSSNNNNTNINNNVSGGQGVPQTVELNRGGKVKTVNLEQLRKPHSLTMSPQFLANHPVKQGSPNAGHNAASSSGGSSNGSGNGNAGGLLLDGDHRPSQNKH